MKEKVVVVTGGSNGIGEALVKHFASLGYGVASLDKRAPDAPVAQVLYLSGDVGKSADVQRFYEAVMEQLGTPDWLICNAGQGITERLAEGDPDLWEAVFTTNVMGPLRIIRAFLPAILDRGRGHVFFVSSVAAQQAFPAGGIYGASKAALNYIAETLRLEVQPHCKVTVIAPGVVDTRFFEHNLFGSQSIESIGWGSIDPMLIARTFEFIGQWDEQSTINQLTIRPDRQSL